MRNLETLADTLKPLGFSSYEAKAYGALASSAPLSGYELAKLSGVPRSMVYETLIKLQGKGAVFALPEDPVRYVALPPSELLARVRREQAAQLEQAELELSKLKSQESIELVYRLEGETRALEGAISLVESARISLTLSLWQAQLTVLEPYLRRARARGVQVRMMLFGEVPPHDLGSVYLHHFIDSHIVENRLQAQLMVLAADGREVLVANLGPQLEGWAVRTRDRALVLVAEEYVRHDVVLAALTAQVGKEVLQNLIASSDDLAYMVRGGGVGHALEGVDEAMSGPAR